MIVFMQKAHVIIVTAFLLFMLVKVVLMFFAKSSTLDAFRAKTKVLDMIMGTFILVTGFYLLFASGGHPPMYQMVKVVLVLVAIPLGIVGFKKSSKILVLLSFFLILYVYGVAETRSLNFQKAKAEEVDTSGMSESEALLATGKSVYTTFCVECHGTDGKLGAFKSPDLTQSNMPWSEAEEMIRNGKGAMRAFKRELSDNQIASVAAYVQTLKEN
jgi:cytochrome c553